MRRAIEVGTIGRNVAENMRRIRTARALTTRQLSARLADLGRKIPASGITRMELAERRVDVDDLTVLASALEIEPRQLMLPPSDLTIEVFVGSSGEAR